MSIDTLPIKPWANYGQNPLNITGCASFDNCPNTQLVLTEVQHIVEAFPNAPIVRFFVDLKSTVVNSSVFSEFKPEKCWDMLISMIDLVAHKIFIEIKGRSEDYYSTRLSIERVKAEFKIFNKLAMIYEDICPENPTTKTSISYYLFGKLSTLFFGHDGPQMLYFEFKRNCKREDMNNLVKNFILYQNLIIDFFKIYIGRLNNFNESTKLWTPFEYYEYLVQSIFAKDKRSFQSSDLDNYLTIILRFYKLLKDNFAPMCIQSRNPNYITLQNGVFYNNPQKKLDEVSVKNSGFSPRCEPEENFSLQLKQIANAQAAQRYTNYIKYQEELNEITGQR